MYWDNIATRIDTELRFDCGLNITDSFHSKAREVLKWIWVDLGCFYTRKLNGHLNNLFSKVILNKITSYLFHSSPRMIHNDGKGEKAVIFSSKIGNWNNRLDRVVLSMDFSCPLLTGDLFFHEIIRIYFNNRSNSVRINSRRIGIQL